MRVLYLCPEESIQIKRTGILRHRYLTHSFSSVEAAQAALNNLDGTHETALVVDVRPSSESIETFLQDTASVDALIGGVVTGSLALGSVIDAYECAGKRLEILKDHLDAGPLFRVLSQMESVLLSDVHQIHQGAPLRSLSAYRAGRILQRARQTLDLSYEELSRQLQDFGLSIPPSVLESYEGDAPVTDIPSLHWMTLCQALFLDPECISYGYDIHQQLVSVRELTAAGTYPYPIRSSLKQALDVVEAPSIGLENSISNFQNN